MLSNTDQPTLGISNQGNTDTVNLPSNEFQGTFSPYALKPKFAVAKGEGGGGGGRGRRGDDDDVYG